MYDLWRLHIWFITTSKIILVFLPEGLSANGRIQVMVRVSEREEASFAKDSLMSK